MLTKQGHEEEREHGRKLIIGSNKRQAVVLASSSRTERPCAVTLFAIRRRLYHGRRG